MPLDSKHPTYLNFLFDWEKMRDCYAGETVIKKHGEKYLPSTPAQQQDGMGEGEKGRLSYDRFKTLAVYHNFLNDAVKSMVGIMHHRPPDVQLPTKLQPMLRNASVQNESLYLLLRRINESQLVTGRIGLMLDLPSKGKGNIPYIATYEAEHIFNWDEGTLEYPITSTLNFVCLDESQFERLENFEWRWVTKHRVLTLGDVLPDEPEGIYRQAFFRQVLNFDPSVLMAPSIMGKTLNEIPFIFVNATDLFTEPQTPPLLEIADICLAIYRGEASYRTHLFMQGQDTFVLSGANREPGEDVRVGAGACLELPQGGKAEYVGVKSEGLAESRSALENDKQRAGELGMKLLNTQSKKPESGEAMQTRVAAQTATLNQIALAGAEGLENILKIAARWVGADPDQVIVKPNLDFADAGITPAEFVLLSEAKAKYGLPLSDEQLHKLLKKNNMTELEYAKEVALILQENATKPSPIVKPDNKNPNMDIIQ